MGNVYDCLSDGGFLDGKVDPQFSLLHNPLLVENVIVDVDNEAIDSLKESPKPNPIFLENLFAEPVFSKIVFHKSEALSNPLILHRTVEPLFA